MFLRTAIATALVIGLLSPAAFAQTTTAQRRPGPTVARPGITGSLDITARQRLQQRCIQFGQRRGAISAAERGHLLARQRQIHALRQRLLATDGRIDIRERLRLHRELNLLSRKIRRFGR